MKNNQNPVGADAHIRPARKEYQKTNTGITLIALIVTIIVLLILAGVSLSLVAGSNGIIGKATTAVDKTNDATILEEVQLVISEGTMQYYLDDANESLAEYLAKNYSGYETASGAIIDFDENGEITYSKGKETTILVMDQNGNVEITEKSIEGGATIDKRAPSIKIDATTDNSITFTITDRVGVVAYAVTETTETPTDWTEITSTTKFTETVIEKTQNKTYYIWAKDATENVSTPVTAITAISEKTVTYDANGGTGNVPASLTKVKYGTNVTVDTTAKLTRTGYSFVGWALTNNATEAISNFNMPENDVTLYAVWSERFYLFNNGDQCTAMTGGWQVQPMDGSRDWGKDDVPGVISNYGIGDNIYMSVDNAGNNEGAITVMLTKNKVKLSDYSTIHLKYSAVSNFTTPQFVVLCTYYSLTAGTPARDKRKRYKCGIK